MLANWSGDIPDGTVWDNSQVQTITGNVHIPAGATLTIQPGTVVQFDAGTNMSVDGTLDASGTAAAPVTFTSYQDSSALGGANNANPGDWGAIAFNVGSQASTLDHVVVKYGGGGNAGEVIVGDSIALSNSTFSNSNAAGMRITGSPTLANDTWENNLAHFGSAGAAISMDLASSPVITGPTLQGNGINAALLDGGSITGSVKWNNPALAYDLSGSVTVPAGASLEIDAGQTVQLGVPYASGYDLIVNGTLHSLGTAAAPVTITSFKDNSSLGGANNAAAGDWGSITFNAGSDASTLDHTVIRYGGGLLEAAETIIAANVAASNSTISNSYSAGLRVITAKPTITADSFLNNGGAAISADLASQPAITGGTPSSITGNGINGMALDSGSFTANSTWNASDVVYVPTGDLTIPSGITLSIGPGVIVKPHSLYNLNVNGTLNAQGTAAAPIIVTSFADDSAGGNSGPHGVVGPGEGLTIWLESGSTGNVMNHVDVRYGQDVVGGNRPGAIDVDSSLTLSNSVVRDCGRDGVLVSPNATATITNCLIVDNTYGIEGQAGANVMVVNNTIDRNYVGVILDAPNATLVNNLITNSGSAGINQTSPTTLTMSYNDVFSPGVGSTNYSGLTDQTGSNGNISVDPKYVNAAGLQYNLQPGSPAEDAGTSNGAPTTDFFGNPRYKDPNIAGRGDGSGYDMGAIEVQQTATSNVDLSVVNVTAPATGMEGQSVTITWTDESVGAGAAVGPWHDAVYLSPSPTLSAGAVLLGQVTHTGNLGPGQSDSTPQSGTFTLPGIFPGNYYVVVLVNSENEVFEGTAVGNNTAASSTAIAMDLPTLAPGTPTSGNFSGLPDQYYKITVPAGESLQVSLTSGNSASVNELYLRFGSLPTSSIYDAAFRGQEGPNQEAIVPAAQAGTYYVLARNAASPADFTLTAQALDFGISGVSPSQVGNGGYATFTIHGAQFSSTATVSLTAPDGSVLQPTVTTVQNAATILATFDLTGHATGAYNVVVNNGQGATATDTGAVQVATAVPGTVTVQMDAPSITRAGRVFQVKLTLTNPSNSDAVMPLLILDSGGAALLGFTADGAGTSQLSVVPELTNGTPGIVPAGGTWQLTVYGRTASDTMSLPLALNTISSDNSPVDQTQLASFLPASIDQDLGKQAAQFRGLMNLISGPTNADFVRSIHFSANQMLQAAPLGTNLKIEDVYGAEYDGLYLLVQNHLLDAYLQQHGINFSTSAANAAVIGAASPATGGTSTPQASPPVNKFDDNADTTITTVYGGNGSGKTRYISAGFTASQNPYNLNDPNDWVGNTANELHRIYPNDTIKTVNWNSGTLGGMAAQATGVGIIGIPAGGPAGFAAGAAAGGAAYYASAADLTPIVGGDIASDVQSSGTDPGDVVIYGHSLGAHAAGYAGEALHGKVGEIVYFDPAGPLFSNPNSGATPNAAKKTTAIVTSGSYGDLPLISDKPILAGRDPSTLAKTVLYPPTDTTGTTAHGYSHDWYLQQLKNTPVGGEPDLSTAPTTYGGMSKDSVPTQIARAATKQVAKQIGINVVQPLDPNNITGPAGHGTAGFVGSNSSLPYLISFENDPKKATAPADNVTVTNQLDPNLDFTTFQLGTIGFGNTSVQVPSGRQTFSTDVDTTNPDGTPLRVHIDAALNVATGVVAWSFTSLDPNTGLPPDNPLDGFLPVDNETTHAGEGYISYTIQAKAGLSTGTTISNGASIVFDTNSPLATPTISNAIDSGAPTSSVAALPGTTTSTTFQVSWSGQDDANGSGIATYDVFVSDNGGPFRQFQIATTQTSATFTGQIGHSYGFYSVATDNVGNRQTTPTTAQASTTVAAVVTPFLVTEHSYVIGSSTITVSASNGLLAGDTGPSQLAVTAGTVTGAQGGTFAINADGSFTYTPGASFPGYDNAQFTVTDASGDKGTATVNVVSQHAGVVWKFYESVLNREPDSGGLQYWTNYFNNGGSTGDMAFGFFESDELLNKVLGNYYEQFLLRPLDADGLAFWKGVWHATGGPEQIKAGFADSPEFYKSSGGTPDSWIDALYQRILSRTPDPSGKTFWLNYYQQQTAAGTDAGTVRFNIALGFFDSQESYGQDVTGWFQEYLFRVPTDAEKAQYVSQMEGGASDRTIEQAITNLPEYGANPSTPADGSAVPLANYYQAPASSAQAQAALAARDKLFGQL